MTNIEKKKYVYTRKINATFYETLDEVRFALGDEGFGVVSTVDIGEKIITKVTSKFGEYKVIGVCHPELAYRYLKHDLEYGVFMPCTIAIYERGGAVHVSVGLPDVMISDIIKDDNLVSLGKEITKTLIKIIDNI